MLPSPTYAIVRPASVPSCSCRVRQSASAWHGCSSSVSAFTTASDGAAAANSSSVRWAKVRITTACTQRSRLRATSATGSRPPSATSAGSVSTSPPSSRTATSKVTRVRSDGLSNSSATCRPASARRRRRADAVRTLLLQARRERQHRLQLARRQVEHGEEPAGTRARTSRRGPVSRGARRQQLRSCAVLSVDAHVLGAEIAGPHRRLVQAPPPRSISISMSVPRRYSAARGASSSNGRPSRNRTTGPMRTRARADVERHARASRRRHAAGPSSGRRRALRSSRAASSRPCAPPASRRPGSPRPARGWPRASSRLRRRARSSAPARGTPPRARPRAPARARSPARCRCRSRRSPARAPCRSSSTRRRR